MATELIFTIVVSIIGNLGFPSNEAGTVDNVLNRSGMMHVQWPQLRSLHCFEVCGNTMISLWAIVDAEVLRLSGIEDCLQNSASHAAFSNVDLL
jgi:hypothetical protein